MVGGGFGGCTIVLCRNGGVDAVRSRVERAYDTRGWRAPDIWTPLPSAGAHRVT
jgi:galactokinase